MGIKLLEYIDTFAYICFIEKGADCCESRILIMTIADSIYSFKLIGKIRMKLRYLFILCCVLNIGWAQAGEVLSDSVREVLQRSVSDQATPKLAFGTQYEADVLLLRE